MKRKGLGAILLASCMLGFFGCSEHSASGPNDVTTLNPEAGRFGLSSMGKLEKRTEAAAVQKGSNVKFNLGKIKGSSGFFFLLYNVGMTPITSVALNVNNPAFSVFPSTMDTLIPGSDVGMLPVIKIAAFHGTSYDGVGNRPLLPMGQNEFTLHISGNSKTASGTDTVITLDAEMDLEALVMDLSIEGINGLLDMSTITSGPVLPLVDKSLKIQANYNTSCIGDSNLFLRNTGNVPLHCYIYDTSVIKIDTIITAGNNIPLALNTLGSCDLIISGDNAVVDPAKLILNENGKFCAKINKSFLNCPDAQVINRFNEYITTHINDNCGKIWALIDSRMMVYGQNYRNGDSITFILYDFVNNELLSSYTGTSSGLVQDDCYKGDYSADFAIIINDMLSSGSSGGKKFGIQSGRITSGGQSNWVTSASFGVTACVGDGQKN